MKPFYPSVTNPNYLQFELMPNDALPVLKTNSGVIEQVLEYFNSLNAEYYIYFLDGDGWGQRDIWKSNTFVDRYDFELSNEFFQLPFFKDCIFQWVDEFIIINPWDVSEAVDQVLYQKDYTMTKLRYCGRHMTFKTVAKLSHLVREKKNVQRGVWYLIQSEELETI